MKSRLKKWSNRGILGLLLCLFLFLPLFVHNQYVLHMLIIIFMIGLPVLGLRLIMISGNLSFGQVAFVAIGAYTSAILVVRVGLSSWFALPISGLMAALCGAAIGWPALRLKGTYFAILSLCMGEAIIRYIDNLPGLTGGASGMFGIPFPNSIEIAGFPLVSFGAEKTPYYYYSLALLSFCLWVMIRIDNSRLGAIFHSIAQSDKLAESIGIKVMRYKVLAFAIACFFSGLGGAFYAHYYIGLHPENFTVWDSIYYVVYVIVGGIRSVFGPLLGALLMLGSFEISRTLAKYQPILYASIFILVILFLPKGLVSLKEKLLGLFGVVPSNRIQAKGNSNPK